MYPGILTSVRTNFSDWEGTALPGYDLRLQAALDAAESVFAEKSYGLATMRDIAAAANLSVAGLYYYLPSKQRALGMVCERAFQALSEGLERALSEAALPDSQLRAFVRHHVGFITVSPAAYRVLLHDMEALEGEDRLAVHEIRRRYFARAADLVIAVQQERTSSISTRIATAALFGMMNWTPMWYRGENESDASHVALEMSTLFLRGVAAPAEEPAAIV